MKDISLNFIPLNVDFTTNHGDITINSYINDDFPVLDKKGVALFNIDEYRGTIQPENKYAHNFRTYLYSMADGFNWSHPLYDLGTIIAGNTIEDTYFAVRTVCNELIKNDIIPLIIGGTQELTKAVYDGYKTLEHLVNLTVVDNKLDLGAVEKPLEKTGWLSHIILQKPCYLFNYTNIGAQSHYIKNDTLKLFDNLYFDICRLGELNQTIRNAEPYMRNTDILSVDLESVRASDHQNPNYTNPNGLFANELCQLMRYAGISDKLTSAGIYNYFSNDNKVTDELVAQLIWYFNDGVAHRKGDFPIGSKRGYVKFRVFLEELDEELLFYKSDKTGRWWIEVPYPHISNSKYIRHQMVPCSYETYLKAMEGELPDLLWKTYQKLV